MNNLGPNCMEALAFETCIREVPDDHTPKLVYADWLEEREYTVEAKLIRDLCQVYSGESVTPYAVQTEMLQLVVRGFFQEKERLGELSDFEKSLLPWFTKSWLAAGLATGPCDRVACENAVKLAYKLVGLRIPDVIIWLNGPLEGSCAASMLSGNQVRNQVVNQVRDQVWNQVGNQVRDQVVNQVWNQVRDQVWNQVVNQVWNQVRNQVVNQVRNQVGNQVWNQVRNQVVNQVRNQVWNQVRNQVVNQVYRCGYGQHDASWLAFYNAIFAFGLTNNNMLSGLFKLVNCGWWWPFENTVILTERPTKLVMSNDNVQYIEYADGLRIDKRS